MFGSAFIEVVIGLAFLYMLLSLICSALNEIVAQLTNLRSKTLEEGLERMLTDDSVRKAFYKHPLIKSLGKKPSEGEVVKPSYIPSSIFALALMDSVSSVFKKPSGEPTKNDSNNETDLTATILNFADARATVEKIENEDLRKSLLTLFDTSDNLEQARKNIEVWFDNVMDRASGWYKRQAQEIILIIALIIIVFMNADTIKVATTLWQSPTLRQGVVAAAENYIAVAESSEEKEKALNKLQQRIEKLRLPFGWSANMRPKGFLEWLMKMFGLLTTAIAVSFGAPFWFDLLNKIVKLRGSGRVPERSIQM